MPVVSEWGMEWTRLRVLTLEPGETYGFACGDAEWIVLPLSGGCEVRCRGAAPDPAPRTPAGLKERDSAPDPVAGQDDGRGRPTVY
ncbi:hypothetical protein ACWGQT_29725, partial [Streptomyces yangpuensis]